MIYNGMSRRYFLQGIGAGLVLPFLPSIMQKAYAATTPTRYVQLLMPYGNPGDYFYPASTVTQNAAGIYSAALSSVNGNLSTLFGTGFNNYKNKMSLIRGLNVLPKSGFEEQHNASYPSAASSVNNGHDPNTNDNYPGLYPFTIDTILGASNKVYPNPNGMQRQVNICPAYQPGTRSNFSWTRINNVVQKVPWTNDTNALLAKFTKLSSGGMATPPSDATTARKTDILNNVFADYKAVRSNPKLSTDDRNRLDSYISLIDSISKSVASGGGAGGTCKTPTMENDADLDGRTRNQLRILAAAIACQLTNVAAVTLIRPDDLNGVGHNKHHDASNADLAAYMKSSFDHVAFFLSQLDSVTEGTGTLLDNSIVLTASEFGERYEGNQSGHIHTHKDMTVMLAGGGAGTLQMGQYIDYRKTGSRPYNNLLVTVFNAMGLTSADYEQDGIVGIGDYDATMVNTFGFSNYVSTTEKRKALPYLYKGFVTG